VRQPLDRDDRMVDLTRRDQIVQHSLRAILHLIDVDAGIKHQPLCAVRARADEWKLVGASPYYRLCGSSRAQRRAASKSNSVTSEAELQLWVDFASRLLERLSEVVLKCDRR